MWNRETIVMRGESNGSFSASGSGRGLTLMKPLLLVFHSTVHARGNGNCSG